MFCAAWSSTVLSEADLTRFGSDFKLFISADTGTDAEDQGALLAVSPAHKAEDMPEKPGAEAAADAAFAARIASGEPGAMREAVELFLPQVLATARRMLKNEADAEEVAQETFLRVWKHAGTWVPKGARLRTWVVRIAMNLCYDRLRKKGHGTSTPIDDAPELIDDQPDAVEGIARDDRAGQVARAIDALPDRQRAAVQLVHFDEMSNIEAAKVMDVSVDALESLLARGRRSLKKALIDHKQDLLGEM